MRKSILAAFGTALFFASAASGVESVCDSPTPSGDPATAMCCKRYQYWQCGELARNTEEIVRKSVNSCSAADMNAENRFDVIDAAVGCALSVPALGADLAKMLSAGWSAVKASVQDMPSAMLSGESDIEDDLAEKRQVYMQCTAQAKTTCTADLKALKQSPGQLQLPASFFFPATGQMIRALTPNEEIERSQLQSCMNLSVKRCFKQVYPSPGPDNGLQIAVSLAVGIARDLASVVPKSQCYKPQDMSRLICYGLITTLPAFRAMKLARTGAAVNMAGSEAALNVAEKKWIDLVFEKRPDGNWALPTTPESAPVGVSTAQTMNRTLLEKFQRWENHRNIASGSEMPLTDAASAPALQRPVAKSGDKTGLFSGDANGATARAAATVPGARTEVREAAEQLLGKLSDEKADALEMAHGVGVGELGQNGGPAGVGNYTLGQLVRKYRILKDARFNETEIRTLMENGVVGIRDRFVQSCENPSLCPVGTTTVSRASLEDYRKAVFNAKMNTSDRYKKSFQARYASLRDSNAMYLQQKPSVLSPIKFDEMDVYNRLGRYLNLGSGSQLKYAMDNGLLKKFEIGVGGEGRIFVNPKTPDFAFKMFHAGEGGSFFSSVQTMISTRDLVAANPVLNKLITMPRVYEVGPGYIIRDFFPDAIRLKQVFNQPEVQATLSKIEEAITNSNNAMLEPIRRGVTRNIPAEDLFWDPFKKRVIIVDALGI